MIKCPYHCPKCIGEWNCDIYKSEAYMQDEELSEIEERMKELLNKEIKKGI